ncbi:ClpXP protease specificity-enhancing factor SspB [Alphaproteobacteria bacterium]|nr:ClpXP protease specificity-enhancing factor SspB [Alphaproteobacteria bacterium]
MTNKGKGDGVDSKGFDYDALVEESLKNVVKKVLLITSETGLLGNSHFFISFNGNNKDVIVPPELKSKDNSEIKIIIQHQFWDLKSLKNHFEVTLSFNGQKKKISVPYKAITSFTDPSVGFGLQFKIEDALDLNIEEYKAEEPKQIEIDIPSEAKKKNRSGEIVSLDDFRDKK